MVSYASARVTYRCARRTFVVSNSGSHSFFFFFLLPGVRAGFNDCSDKNVNTHKRSARRRRRLRRRDDDDDDDDEGRRLRLRVPRTRKSRGHRSGPDGGGRVDPVSREDGRTRARARRLVRRRRRRPRRGTGAGGRPAGYPARGRVRTRTRYNSNNMCERRDRRRRRRRLYVLFAADRGRAVEELRVHCCRGQQPD